jgi:altronate hydrolase
MNKIIQLHPADNVGVLLQDMKQGETLDFEGHLLTLRSDIGFGHKVALTAIAQGQHVLKYGLPIGSAIHDIAAGEHVHVQNIISNYQQPQDL